MANLFHYTTPLEQEISLIKGNEVLDEVVISLFKQSYKINQNALRIAIIGDTHGNITLALQKLEEWVNYSNLKFDSILQVGDLGVFPTDKTSKEMGRKDPDEEGFIDYFYQSKEADYFFGEKGIFSDIDFYFINGNHDNMEFINNEVDARTLKLGHYENIHYIPDGKQIEITKNNNKIIVGALGFHHKKGDIQKLSKSNSDILLSHVPPKDIQKNLSNIKSKYHFFGHAHKYAVA